MKAGFMVLGIWILSTANSFAVESKTELILDCIKCDLKTYTLRQNHSKRFTSPPSAPDSSEPKRQPLGSR